MLITSNLFWLIFITFFTMRFDMIEGEMMIIEMRYFEDISTCDFSNRIGFTITLFDNKMPMIDINMSPVAPENARSAFFEVIKCFELSESLNRLRIVGGCKLSKGHTISTTIFCPLDLKTCRSDFFDTIDLMFSKSFGESCFYFKGKPLR